jgi:hypothetical protein
MTGLILVAFGFCISLARSSMRDACQRQTAETFRVKIVSRLDIRWIGPVTDEQTML